MEKSKNNNNKYKIGQYIVYPMQGVGYIEKIEEKMFNDELTPYFIIILPGMADMKIMCPCTKIEDLGIRPIVSKKVAQATIEKLKSPIPFTDSTDWKTRYQINMDLAKSGSVDDVAAVVSFLYTRSKQKELPVMERKLFDTVKRLLFDELSQALEQPTSEIESIVNFYLEENCEKLNISTKKVVASLEDDIVEALPDDSDEDQDEETDE